MAKTSLPRYNERYGWRGGDSRTLYAFVDRRTGSIQVEPGGIALLSKFGPENNVRVATKAEAEAHWQKPLHAGWKTLGRSEFNLDPTTAFQKHSRAVLEAVKAGDCGAAKTAAVKALQRATTLHQRDIVYKLQGKVRRCEAKLSGLDGYSKRRRTKKRS